MNKNKKLLFSIVGIFLLIIIVTGSTYAYLIATNESDEITSKTAKIDLELNVKKLSTGTNDMLIPIDNSSTVLTTAAKGYGFSGTEYDASKSCIDKNGYTVCQVYEITIKNKGSDGVSINGGVTSLSGAATPNLACTVMTSSILVSNIVSCLSETALANNVVLSGNSEKTYYIMVYIADTNNPQSDSGLFNGTVTFASANDEIQANFN